MKKYLSISVIFLLAIIINSCGLMFYGPKQKVQVNSTPAGAKIFVNGEYTGQTTPAQITVTRRVKDSPTSTKQKMTYKLVKEGYSDYIQVDNSKFNTGSFICSALVGGFIGIGIDAGAGVNRSYPKVVNANLTNGSSSSSNGLLIDRASEVPPAETTNIGSSSNQTVSENNNNPASNTVNENNSGTVSISIPNTEKDAGTVSITPPAQPNAGTVSISPTNLREKVWQEMKKTDYASANSNSSISISSPEPIAEASSKLKKTEENAAGKDLKYRRSSLYTLMVNDPNREFADIIYDAFGNAVIPSKFNDHNIGPYLIEGQGGVKDEDAQSKNISDYLSSNKVANALVAKWFNRNSEGKFNMNLIA